MAGRKIRRVMIPFLILVILAVLATGIAAEGAQTYTATPSADNTTLNGSPVTMQAYKINGSNYVKLRDFAQMVNGTPLNFEVTWDGGLNAINMYTPQAYTPVGGEGAPVGTEEKQAADTTSTIYVNGQVVSLKGYNINNNNYFKLRDLGTALGIGIGWDNATRTVVVDSTGNTEIPETTPQAPTQDSMTVNFGEIGEDGRSELAYVILPDGTKVVSGSHIDQWKPGDHFSFGGTLPPQSAEESAASWEGVIIGSND